MATAHLRYHYEPEGWWAESPEFPDYSAFGASLEEVRELAHDGLRFFTEDDELVILDPISELLTAVSMSLGVTPQEAEVAEYFTGKPLLQYTDPDESTKPEAIDAHLAAA